MLTRRLAATVAAAALCMALETGTALGASDNKPEVGTFHQQQDVSFIVDDLACFAGQPGQVTGTDTVDGHFNNSPDMFHFEGLETLDSRVDFPDGTYVLGTLTTRFADNFNTQATYLKDTRIEHGQGVVYAPDGSEIGPVSSQATFHATWQDLNGNHQIDADEIQGGIDRLNILSCP